jgi:acyl carrier protein
MSKDIIRQFIIDNYLFGDGNNLKETDSFREKGLIDSTGIMELIAFLEETFQIRIEDHEITPENLDSIDNITNFITNKMLLTERT